MAASATAHSYNVRICHWVNLVACVYLLWSGVHIFLDFPELYWGHTGYRGYPAAFRLADWGLSWDEAGAIGDRRWGRNYHFTVAWVFLFNGLVYVVWNLYSTHFRDRMWPGRDGSYGTLQKTSYLILIFVFVPLMILTGIAQSPGFTAAMPALLDMFGGRQSARTLHTIGTVALVLFVLVHVVEVARAGFFVKVRSMIMEIAMSTRISRRRWLTTSVPALGGLLLTGCSRETFVPPRVRGGLIGAADVLTMSTNRLLLSGQQLAREYSRSDVADPFPTWNQINPRNAEYQRHASEGFKNWRLPIGGLVSDPRELSLDEIRGLPARTQITAHVCEQGWSAIGEWTGAPLQRMLDMAGGVTPAARYLVIDTFDGWYEGYDLFEVAHAQTILAYKLNGRDLPRGNGAPLRLRVERQCGYKNLKFVKSIRVVDSMAGIGKGTGGINSDFGFHWFAGV